MKKFWVIVLGLCTILVVCLILLISFQKESNAVFLRVLCAAGLRVPVEEIAKNYERDYNIKIELTYGGSGELLSQLDRADVYIPADSTYVAFAKEMGKVSEDYHIGILHPCVMVLDEKWDQLTIEEAVAKEMKIAIADVSSAIGKVTQEVFEERGIERQIKEGSYSSHPTVIQVANQVMTGAADMGIVWKSLEQQFPNAIFYELDIFEQHSVDFSASTLIRSEMNKEASRFAHYLTKETKGFVIFSKNGFDVKGE